MTCTVIEILKTGQSLYNKNYRLLYEGISFPAGCIQYQQLVYIGFNV